MSKSALAGAIALVAGPLLGFVGVILLPTISDDAPHVVSAATAHRSAMIFGLTLQTLGIAALIAGIVWLAVTLLPRAPRLAVTGGVLGVAGGLVILFEDGLTAATPSIVSAVDTPHATTVIHQVNSSVAAGIDPLATVFAVGLAVLGFATAKAGAPRWVGPAVTVAAAVQTVGFAIGSRAVTVVGFAALVVALALVVNSVRRPSAAASPAREAVAVA